MTVEVTSRAQKRVPRRFSTDRDPQQQAVFHDRTVVRLEMVVAAPQHLTELRLDGGLQWKRSSKNRRALTAVMPVNDLGGEALAEVAVTLDFSGEGPGVFKTRGAACIHLNGMRLVRALLGLEQLGPSTDGRTNWIGDCGDMGPQVEEGQYDAFSYALDAVVEQVLAALPKASNC